MYNNLNIGDKLLIISNKLSNRSLALLNTGDVITVTGVSDNNKIVYYCNSLAIPNNKLLFRKIS